LLGISKKEYSRWDAFNNKVLLACQQALAECTDIRYTYETSRKGKGGKVYAVNFKIFKNENHVDKLCFEKFLDQKTLKQNKIISEVAEQTQKYQDKKLEYLAQACDDEFSETEMKVLAACAEEKIVNGEFLNGSVEEEFASKQFVFLKKKYTELLYHAEKRSIKRRFSYFKKLIDAVPPQNFFKNKNLPSKKNYIYSHGEQSYDLVAYENTSIFDN
jgi:plasmid replication initiation protein